MEIEAVLKDGSGLTLSFLNGQEVEISDWSYCRVNLVVQLHDFSFLTGHKVTWKPVNG